jgi:threonine dehydratase
MVTDALLGLDRAALDAAAEVVYRVMAPTPLYAWPKLARRAGCTVFVKHEDQTPTGAFKVRGGIVFMDRLRREQPQVSGVVSATRGNHGQSLSFAAQRAGLQATIYVPQGNSPDQNTAISGFGATLVEFGRDFDEAKHEAHRVAQAGGLLFVPSFHRDLVAGVASYGMELFRAQPDVDTVYVGVGMGSGICGLIAARDALGLRTNIVGVGPTGAPAQALTFAAGGPVGIQPARTFADGLATREPDPEASALIRRGAARFVQVSEDEIAAAIRAYFDDTHHVVEGAGAAPLAAALQERDRHIGKNIAVILSGANIERARFQRVLAGETPLS